MSQLFLSNVPWNCQKAELRDWIESNGFHVDSIHVIRDLVTNASPIFAYVTLYDNTQNDAAIDALNGQKLMGSVLRVQEDRRRHEPNLETRRTSER